MRRWNHSTDEGRRPFRWRPRRVIQTARAIGRSDLTDIGDALVAFATRRYPAAKSAIRAEVAAALAASDIPFEAGETSSGGLELLAAGSDALVHSGDAIDVIGRIFESWRD
jgi:hypothetical protein